MSFVSRHYPDRKQKIKEIKLEDLYMKNHKEKRHRNRSKTPRKIPKKSEIKKGQLPKLSHLNSSGGLKSSIVSSGFKEKKRGIVNTRKLAKKKEKLNSRQSFKNELIAVNANANSAQNSVGPYHSSKTDNNPGIFLSLIHI